MTDRVTRRTTLTALAGASPLLITGSAPARENLIPAGAAPSKQRSLTDRVRELPISITDFGAMGDGDPVHASTNSAAIQAAMTYALSVLPRTGNFARGVEIFIPPGVFVINPNALDPPTSCMGLSFRGAGWFGSVLRLVPGGRGERWIFNPPGAEPAAFCTFADLCFEGRDMSRGDANAVPAGANLMRIEAHHTGQGFRFDRCLIQGFDTCFQFEGTNLASECKFINCKVFGCNTVVSIANHQSFNTDFIGSEVELIYQSVFHFRRTAAGPAGGAVRLSHASLIPAGGGAIVRLDGSMLSQGVVIRDTRVEMRDRSSFFKGMGDQSYGELTLVDCGILNTQTAGVRRMAEVGPGQTLRFVRCLFNTLGQDERYAFIPQRNRYMSGPRLLWEDCQLPFDMAAKIDNRGEGNHAGQASARNCRTNEGQGNDEGVIHAANFDLSGQGGTVLAGSAQPNQGGDAHLRCKTVALKLGTSPWPYVDGDEVVSETRLVLPPYARILRIIIVKDAQGQSAAPYALRVRTEAGTVLLDTPPVAQSSALAARYDPEAENRVPHACGTALPERTLVLTCRPGTGPAATDRVQQGYAYLEYL